MLYSPRLLERGGDEALRLVAAGVRLVGEHFEVAVDHRQRRAHLVRHVGDEIAPHGFEALDMGHVAGQQQLALVAEGDRLDRQHVAGQAGRRHQHAGNGRRAVEHGDELGLAHQIAERQPDIALEVDTELLFGDDVGRLDQIGALQDDDAVGHRLHRVALALQLMQQMLAVLCRDAAAPVQGGEDVAPGAAAGRNRRLLG